MAQFFKKIIKFFLIKRKFPKSKVAFSATVSMDTTLEEGVKIGNGSRIGSCKISRYSYIGTNSQFERTTIGSFCSIGSEVICGLGKHPLNFISTYPGFYTNKASGAEWFGYNHDVIEHQSILIGSDVWIGTRSIILDGVKIGDGAVIGAGSIVTKDIPAHAVVAGVPAKIIRYRFDEALSKKILNSKWWELPKSTLMTAARFAVNPEEFIQNLNR